MHAYICMQAYTIMHARLMHARMHACMSPVPGHKSMHAVLDGFMHACMTYACTNRCMHACMHAC